MSSSVVKLQASIHLYQKITPSHVYIKNFVCFKNIFLQLSMVASEIIKNKSFF